MDRNAKLRATSGTTNIHQQSSPLSHHKYREIHYNIGTAHVSILKTPLETELFDPTLAVVLFQMSEAFSRTVPCLNPGETFSLKS